MATTLNDDPLQYEAIDILARAGLGDDRISVIFQHRGKLVERDIDIDPGTMEAPDGMSLDNFGRVSQGRPLQPP